MRLARAGTLLRLLGLFVGLAAASGLLLGFDVSRISPFLIRVAIYKLAFIVALALLAGGAVIGRRARGKYSSGTARERL
jgi:hypothetical protein